MQRKFILPFLTLFLLSACNKENWELTDLNTNEFSVVCMNEKKSEGPNGKNAPYTHLAWMDGFNGKNADIQEAASRGETIPEKCYDDDSLAVCTQALSWKEQTHAHCAGASVSHLKDLNKCTWTLWKGYSILDKSGLKSYDPSSIQMKFDSSAGFNPDGTGKKMGGGSGVLSLQVHVNYNTASQTGACDDSSLNPNCPIVMGGIDSNYRNGTTQGRDIQLGRVEIRAKMPSKITGSYPSLWLWPVNNGVGNPVIANNHGYAGEIDLWESPRDYKTPFTYGTQHYHTWNGNDHAAKGFGAMINDNEYHRFGVEKFDSKLKFYIDNCYIGEVNRNSKADRGTPNLLPVDAQTLYTILGMGTSADAASNKNRWQEIDGQEMLVDYVKIFDDKK